MPLNDIIYFISFAAFLIGMSLNFRDIKKRPCFWIMTISILADFFATILPNNGFKSMSINVGSSAMIMSAISLGIFVWILFLIAVSVRVMEKYDLFNTLITAVSVLWFLDIILYMYGVYTL